MLLGLTVVTGLVDAFRPGAGGGRGGSGRGRGGIAAVVGDPGSGVARYVLIVLLGAATGTQNAAARRLAVPDLTTTVLTLPITGIFADGRLAGGVASKHRVARAAAPAHRPGPGGRGPGRQGRPAAGRAGRRRAQQVGADEGRRRRDRLRRLDWTWPGGLRPRSTWSTPGRTHRRPGANHPDRLMAAHPVRDEAGQERSACGVPAAG